MLFIIYPLIFQNLYYFVFCETLNTIFSRTLWSKQFQIQWTVMMRFHSYQTSYFCKYSPFNIFLCEFITLLCYITLHFRKLVSTAMLVFLTLNVLRSCNKFDIFLFSEYHRNTIMDFYLYIYLLLLEQMRMSKYVLCLIFEVFPTMTTCASFLNNVFFCAPC